MHDIGVGLLYLIFIASIPLCFHMYREGRVRYFNKQGQPYTGKIVNVRSYSYGMTAELEIAINGEKTLVKSLQRPYKIDFDSKEVAVLYSSRHPDVVSVPEWTALWQ